MNLCAKGRFFLPFLLQNIGEFCYTPLTNYKNITTFSSLEPEHTYFTKSKILIIIVFYQSLYPAQYTTFDIFATLGPILKSQLS